MKGIKCKACGEVVVSQHRHDFRACSCGAVAVDGGRSYFRVVTASEVDAYEIVDVKEQGR